MTTIAVPEGENLRNRWPNLARRERLEMFASLSRDQAENLFWELNSR
jgi:hypothetical protein